MHGLAFQISSDAEMQVTAVSFPLHAHWLSQTQLQGRTGGPFHGWIVTGCRMTDIDRTPAWIHQHSVVEL